tara:strand:+ start:1076 stop:1693 length:618 start_codon:yes stop_codon:yes gene_type:complete
MEESNLMITFNTKLAEKPYLEFFRYYQKAIEGNQRSVEAISISSWNAIKSEVNSRFVNLKHIDNDKWTFYSNYDGPKMTEFLSHNQISALFYWNSINVQIRMKAKIYRTSADISDKYFMGRSKEKNALAISSMQSLPISSYDEVIKNYNKILTSDIDLTKRPVNWGGHSFTPYYFEFWEGDAARLNRRKAYSKVEEIWEELTLQP